MAETKTRRGAKSKLTDAQWAEIDAMMEQGRTARSLAEEYGVSPTIVSRRFPKRPKPLRVDVTARLWLFDAIAAHSKKNPPDAKILPYLAKRTGYRPAWAAADETWREMYLRQIAQKRSGVRIGPFWDDLEKWARKNGRL